MRARFLLCVFYVFDTVWPVRSMRSSHSCSLFRRRFLLCSVDLSLFAAYEVKVLGAVVDALAPTQPLAGFSVLLLQHQMAQHVAFVDALRRLGADLTHSVAIDVPYSAHDVVAEGVTRLGLGHLDRHQFTLQQAYGPYQRRRMEGWIRRLAAGWPKPMICIDDGGYLVEALAAMHGAAHGPGDGVDVPVAVPPALCGVVEQTARGLIKTRAHAAVSRAADGVTLVNVAESTTKKTAEPEFIAGNILGFLQVLLEGHVPHGARAAIPPDFRALGPDSTVLCTGYGAIGAAVARLMRTMFGCAVAVSDPRPEAAAAAAADGFVDVTDVVTGKVPPPRGFNPFQVVVGTSGSMTPSVDPLVHAPLLADDVLLISASSSNEELGFGVLRDAAAGSPQDASVLCTTPDSMVDPTRLHDTVSFDVCVSGSGRTQRLAYVNGGFPLTFLGCSLAVCSEDISFTLACLVLGACQAAVLHGTGQGPRGIVPLAEQLDGWAFSAEAARRSAELGDALTWPLGLDGALRAVHANRQPSCSRKPQHCTPLHDWARKQKPLFFCQAPFGCH